MQQSNIQATPIFYQSITDRLFQRRIEFHFPIPSSPQAIREDEAEESTRTLTYEEENAIRYAAGYVLRAVKKKTMKSSSAQKDQLVEAIDIILRNDNDIEEDASSNWITVVDRGGLLHISDDLYRVFVAMELDIRRYLRVERASKVDSHNEGKIVGSLLANEDVQFYWVCCEIQEELAEEILRLIATLWTTIRGFSFAKSYMEIYKQKTKRTLQRSKALRKNLLSGNME